MSERKYSPPNYSFDNHLPAKNQSNIIAVMKDCTLCPRNCHVNRLRGQVGYCGQTAQLMAARAALHFWEEPSLSGKNGSGTVFFSGCSLRCIYCQNYHIALGKTGHTISIQRLSEIFLELQTKGAHNINLVTPTHFVPQICNALDLAKQQGLRLPVIYNTSSYEHVETLRMLEGLVDIYLPDMKYQSAVLSKAYSNAPDYFTVACKAIAEMVRQTGSPSFSSGSQLMTRGVIIRHLLLPGQAGDSKRILRYLYNTFGDSIYISIMKQYTPLEQVCHIPELNRTVTEAEYNRVLDFAQRIGIRNGYQQEGKPADESFIPMFDGEGL